MHTYSTPCALQTYNWVTDLEVLSNLQLYKVKKTYLARLACHLEVWDSLPQVVQQLGIVVGFTTSYNLSQKPLSICLNSLVPTA